jgi:alanyl-tRNA synthetase
MISHSKLRELFKQYWEQRGHKEVFPAPLVLQNDPTTLFTSSGMQQLVPFLAGETHPLGKRLFDIQPSFRAVDIDEVMMTPVLDIHAAWHIVSNYAI